MSTEESLIVNEGNGKSKNRELGTQNSTDASQPVELNLESSSKFDHSSKVGPHRITITSGKGGVGKSSFSSNLALSLAKKGARVLLFDADLQLANLDLILGIQPEFTLVNVVKGEKTLGEILCDAPYGLKVVCGGSGISQLMNAGPKRLNLIYEQLAELSNQFDIFIFDTGAGVDNRMVSFCKNADEITLVTTPDPSSITDSYAVVKIMGQKAAHVPIHVAFNGVVGTNEAIALYRILNETTTKFLNMPIAFLGSIRHDDTMRASVRARRPIVCTFPQAPAALDIEAVAGEILGRHIARAA